MSKYKCQDGKEEVFGTWLINDISNQRGNIVSDVFKGGDVGFQLSYNLHSVGNFCVSVELSGSQKKYSIATTIWIHSTKKGNTIKKDVSVLVLPTLPRFNVTFLCSTSAISAEKGYIDNNKMKISYRFVYTNPENGRRPANSTIVNSRLFLEEQQKGTTRKITGYVGLKSCGATCYMNSVLISLFHIPVFRNVVYQMQLPQNEDPETSIITNTQRLFYELLASESPCPTKHLAKSFGWGRDFLLTQHDAQEFLMVFLSSLEEHSDVKDKIGQIFDVKIRQNIKCNGTIITKDVSNRDFLLPVEGVTNITAALRRFTAHETINDYQLDDGTKATAEIWTEVLSLPPVLTFHLTRFNYDRSLRQSVKINSRFEYPDELDLSFLINDDTKNNTSDTTYVLFGVLVHSGTIESGHYAAHIQPKPDGKWFFFSDENVKISSSENAIKANYGGPKDENARADRTNNAYMLLYARKSELSTIFMDIPIESVPQAVVTFSQTQRANEIKQKLARNAVDARLLTTEDIATHTAAKGCGVFDQSEFSKGLHFPNSKKNLAIAYYESAKGVLKYDHFRLWRCEPSGVPVTIIRKQGGKMNMLDAQPVLFAETVDPKTETSSAVEPAKIVPPMQLKISDRSEDSPAFSLPHLNLSMGHTVGHSQLSGLPYHGPFTPPANQNTPVSPAFSSNNNKDGILHFIKVFAPANETNKMQFLTPARLHPSATGAALFEIASAHGLTPLNLYREVHIGLHYIAEPFSTAACINTSQNSFGSIWIVDVREPFCAKHAPEVPPKFHLVDHYENATEFVDERFASAEIEFSARGGRSVKRVVRLSMPTRMLKQEIAAALDLDYDPQKGSLLLYANGTGAPLSDVPHIASSYGSRITVERFEHPEAELPSLKALTVHVFDGARHESTLIWLIGSETASEVKDALVRADIIADGKYYYYTEALGRIVNELSGGDRSLVPTLILHRVEPCTEQYARLVECCSERSSRHGQKTPEGLPFLFYARLGEPFAETKRRIAQYLPFDEVELSHAVFFLTRRAVKGISNEQMVRVTDKTDIYTELGQHPRLSVVVYSAVQKRPAPVTPTIPASQSARNVGIVIGRCTC